MWKAKKSIEEVSAKKIGETNIFERQGYAV